MGQVQSLFDCAVNPLVSGEDAAASLESAADGPPRPLIIEDAAPLRESQIWRLQREFYAAHGVHAWTTGTVPNFVTSNAYIAKGYAKVAMGLLRDTYGGPASNVSTPVLIVELGAGHGKLGYLIVETLLRYRSFYPPHCVPSGVPFKYILTGKCAPPRTLRDVDALGARANVAHIPFICADAFPATVDAWERNPSLRDFIEAGVVDTAVFDAERDTSVRAACPLFRDQDSFAKQRSTKLVLHMLVDR